MMIKLMKVMDNWKVDPCLLATFLVGEPFVLLLDEVWDILYGYVGVEFVLFMPTHRLISLIFYENTEIG